MKLKSALSILTLGIFSGFIFGLVKSLNIISSNAYFHYKLYRLILFELAGGINKGLVYGLAIAIIFCLLLAALLFIWRKFISSFLEIKIIKKNKLTPLFKAAFSFFIFAYLILKIVELLQSPSPQSSSFLFQSLVVLAFFFAIIKLENIRSFFSRSGILIFIKRFGAKTAFGTSLSIFLVLNILTFSQRLLVHPSSPNILLIVADALRADHLGFYGYDRPTSPSIDKFAAEALVFEKAMSNSPWTKPSMGSVFTSLYPHEHGAMSWSSNLSDKCLTLAELLRNRNYLTFAIQTNPSITKNHNFKQGFQHYEEMVLEKSETVASNFNSWVKKIKKAPFFAYLHYMDTHVPYNAPKEFAQIFGLKDAALFTPGEFQTADVRLLNEIGLTEENKRNLLSLYDGAIKYFDHNFGKIIDNLKKQGILDKTIIILTADHGEEFWEHSGFAHGHNLYREVLHVPLIMKFSTKLPSKKINSFVQLIDIFPTVLRIAGIKYGFSCRGYDLIRSAFGNKQADEQIFMEGILYGPKKKGLLKNGWMLIKNTKEKSVDTFDPLGDMTKYIYPKYGESFELYNINQDLSEKTNLIDDFPKIAMDLDRDLSRQSATTFVSAKEKKTKLKEKLEDLKTLGYIK
jgi:arylsulfatase A-like enzyme